MRITVFLFFALLLATPLSSHAHETNTAYLSGQFNNRGIFTGEWQLRFADLERVVGIQGEADHNLRLQVLHAQADKVRAYLQQNLQFTRDQKACSVAIGEDWQTDTHYKQDYLVVPMRVQCALAGEVTLNYNALFELEGQHQLLFSLTNQSTEQTRGGPRILSNTSRTLSFNAEKGSPLATFKEFVAQGAIHIWIGYDHILFLLSLLIGSVLIHSENHWMANSNTRQIITKTAWIVSAFTLAHSITLTATALNWFHLPSQWIEVSIAISVALAALNNIFPLVLRLGWLTFGFGLIHGMGFAGALGELGLPADQQFLTVLAFNIGVELGQMAIVILVLPIIMWARQYSWYARYGITWASAMIAVIAAAWTIQRII